MTTMKVALLRGVEDLVIEERPVPVAGPGQVLVQINSVGVCGSDVHYYEHGRIADFVVREPMILGHESGGVITAVGPGVDPRRVGQRVSVEPGVPDLTCQECKEGRYNLCPQMRFFATPPIDGSLAEYVAVHESFAYPVPDSISDDAAALMEPLSVGIWSNRKGRVGPGSRVLITGAGPIGLVATQCAQAFGATQIVVTDVNDHRLALARDLGATDVLNVGSTALADAGLEVDVLIECSGNAKATGDGIRALGPDGRAVLVGMGGDEVAIPLGHLQTREINLTGTFRYANTWPTAIALVAAGRIDVDRLVTGHFGLADTVDALLAGKRDPHAVKSVINPQI
jgi:L-iditol 2-dehydrogenase